MEKKKKLLLVDDIREFLMLVKRVLSKEYEVITARDGQQALQMMEQGLEPDLILTDLMMPNVDGYQLITRVKSMKNGYSRIPLVVLSNADQPSEKRKALNQGACGFIPKPFHPQHLTENLRESLQNALVDCN